MASETSQSIIRGLRLLPCWRPPLLRACLPAAASRTLHALYIPLEYTEGYRPKKQPASHHEFLPATSRCFSSAHALMKERANKRNTGKQKPKLIVDHDELQKLFDVNKYTKDLEKAVLDFRDELTKHFSLRTRIASFDSIPVTISGTKYSLNDIAQITFRTPQLVMVNMTSMPQHAKAVVEAINKSGMNVNPQMEGHLIFVPLPKVSRDHREQLAKNAKQALEAAKATVRRLQNANVGHVKIMTHVGEDVLHNASLMIMQEADSCLLKLEELLRAKEQELLQ